MQQSKHQCFERDLQVHVQMPPSLQGYHGCVHEDWERNLLAHYENVSGNEDGPSGLIETPFCRQKKKKKKCQELKTKVNIKAVLQNSASFTFIYEITITHACTNYKKVLCHLFTTIKMSNISCLSHLKVPNAPLFLEIGMEAHK